MFLERQGRQDPCPPSSIHLAASPIYSQSTPYHLSSRRNLFPIRVIRFIKEFGSQKKEGVKLIRIFGCIGQAGKEEVKRKGTEWDSLWLGSIFSGVKRTGVKRILGEEYLVKV
jgi:hypothetical protein